MRNLIAGSLLHDVEKIGFNDAVLRKPGALTEVETQRLRKHVILGLDIVAKAQSTYQAREVIKFHHEHFDGTGYARGLRGEAIPLKARIFAVVDVFDALTSERPYKRAFDYEQAMSLLSKERGRHLDPVVLDAFINIADDFYRNVSHASDKMLESILTALENKYFRLDEEPGRLS